MLVKPKQNTQEAIWRWSTFFLIILFIKCSIIFSYGNATPYWDQWNGEAGNLYLPWLDGSLGLSDLLAPHNEHRIFTMRLLSLGLLVINSNVWNPLLEMYVNAVIHSAALTFLLYCISTSIEDSNKKYLGVFSIALFIIPFGWENTLAGFQSQFYLLLLFSFVFLWAVACEKEFTFKWWVGIVAGFLCPLSLASGAITLFIGAFIVAIRNYFYEKNSDKYAYIVAAALFSLSVTALFFTPTIPYHSSLKAHNFLEFISALMKVTAWPARSVYAGLIIQVPIIFFAFLFFTRKNWREYQSSLFLIAIGAWVFSQFFTISYGRYSGSLASRYLDLFAVGLVINFAIFFICLAYISNKKLVVVIKILMCIWLGLVSIGLISRVPDIFNQLGFKKETSLQQEKNVRAYLCTGNISHLTNKPFLYVPFPDVDYLKGLLDNPHIRKILPGNLSLDNSTQKMNPDGTPYCNFESLNPPFELLDIKQIENKRIAIEPQISFDGWKGGDYFRTHFPGIKVIGSYVTSDADIGILTFSLKRGDRILYRSGPSVTRQAILINGGNNNFSTYLPTSPEWITLDFSNAELPDKFDVTLIDAGRTWGEWSAIGFREQ